MILNYNNYIKESLLNKLNEPTIDEILVNKLNLAIEIAKYNKKDE